MVPHELAGEEIFTLQYLERYKTIIPLLAYFKYGKVTYLIFPLADGDFEDYMKANEASPPHNFLEVFTMALVRSIKVLHCPDEGPMSSADRMDRRRVDKLQNKVLRAVLHRDLVSMLPRDDYEGGRVVRANLRLSR